MASIRVTGASGKAVPSIDRPAAELLRKVFPSITLPRDIGVYETLLAINSARDLLGFVPQDSWRDTLSVDGSDNNDANGGEA